MNRDISKQDWNMKGKADWDDCGEARFGCIVLKALEIQLELSPGQLKTIVLNSGGSMPEVNEHS